MSNHWYVQLTNWQTHSKSLKERERKRERKRLTHSLHSTHSFLTFHWHWPTSEFLTFNRPVIYPLLNSHNRMCAYRLGVPSMVDGDGFFLSLARSFSLFLSLSLSTSLLSPLLSSFYFAFSLSPITTARYRPHLTTRKEVHTVLTVVFYGQVHSVCFALSEWL